MRLPSALLSMVLVLPTAVAAQSFSDSGFLSAVSAGFKSLKESFQRRAALSAASRQEEEALLKRLHDRDPEVRRSALKGLKAYVNRTASTRQRVTQLLMDAKEDLGVRFEAAKSLSAAAGWADVYEALLKLALRGPDERLRVIAYKALYWQARALPDIRDYVLDAARREKSPEVRKAAIWALFNTTDAVAEPREALFETALSDKDLGTRVEALKSLYGAMGYEDIRGRVIEWARDSKTEPAVRYAAILMLAKRHNNAETALLKAIADNDPDPKAREAAVTALGDPESDAITRYFHLIRRDLYGRVIDDPIDHEKF